MCSLNNKKHPHGSCHFFRKMNNTIHYMKETILFIIWLYESFLCIMNTTSNEQYRLALTCPRREELWRTEGAWGWVTWRAQATGVEVYHSCRRCGRLWGSHFSEAVTANLQHLDATGVQQEETPLHILCNRKWRYCQLWFYVFF